MNNIRLDISKAANFRRKDALDNYESQAVEALKKLEAGTCKGNDFLGWVNLPSSITPAFLADIKAWRDAFCARLDWQPHYPLFGSNTASLARTMLDGGLRARLCCVDTTQLDARFAGRDFDESLLADLPAGVDPCGENGEFHTCVHAGPMFDASIAIERSETVLRDGRFAYTDFELATAARDNRADAYASPIPD